MRILLDEHRRVLHDEQVKFMNLQQERERRINEYRNSVHMIKKYLRIASVKDYSEWLNGYLKNGGKITHHYDYNLSRMCVAMGDFHLPPLHGACSFDIIVPTRIHITYDDLGHNNLYFMKDFSNVGSFVPCYNDVAEYFDRAI